MENFKIEILVTLSLQLDILQIKKQEEHNATLSIFFPRCRKIHPLKECPLNNIEICAICVGEHSTKHSPSLPILKLYTKEGMRQQNNFVP